jgi:hypothetical protein
MQSDEEMAAPVDDPGGASGDGDPSGAAGVYFCAGADDEERLPLALPPLVSCDQALLEEEEGGRSDLWGFHSQPSWEAADEDVFGAEASQSNPFDDHAAFSSPPDDYPIPSTPEVQLGFGAWAPRFYEGRTCGSPSVFCEFVERRQRGDAPCVLTKPEAGARFAVAPSRRLAAEYIARCPKGRRYFNEKIMVGHSGHSDEGLRFESTRPYFDFDLTFLKGDEVIIPEAHRPDAMGCLKDAVRIVAELLRDCYGVGRDRSAGDYEDLLVMTACTTRKISYHIVAKYAVGDRFALKEHLRGLCDNLTWDPVIDPDLAPYGTTQDFRLVHNCKGPGNPNYLQPVTHATFGSWHGRFAAWPSGPTEEATIALQIEHSMVCEVPADAEKLEPRVLLPRRACARSRLADADDEAPRLATSGPLEQSLQDVLAAWEVNAHGQSTGATVRQWISAETAYVANGRVGHRVCPHGHTYHRNNFHLRLRGRTVDYGCVFTMAGGLGGSCEGAMWNKIGQLPPSLWLVPRLTYEYEVGGRPRARPFPRDFHGIVDSSEMGMGKTFQLVELIKTLGSSASVLLILHSVSLCESFMDILEGLGFELYSDTTGVLMGRRIVVCINSLARVPSREFDLVAIDETPEVVASLVTLRPRVGFGTKWVVWDRLRDCMRHATRRLFMSAQSDALVQAFLAALGVEEAQWQMAQGHPLSILRYYFVYCESEQLLYGELVTRLQEGQHLIVPMAEHAQLQMALAVTKEIFGSSKRVAVIHGRMSDGARADALAQVIATSPDFFRPGKRTTSHRYDAVFFTCSLASGVTILNEDLHYDACVFLLNNRCINADVCIQMVQRCRSYRRNEVVFMCDPHVRDYDRKPGYTSSRVDALPADAQMVDARSVAAALRDLVREYELRQAPEYYLQTPRGCFKLARRRAPRRCTEAMARAVLLTPARMNHVLRSGAFDGNERLAALMDAAQVVKMAELLPEYEGFVKLMVVVAQREMNIRCDLVPELVTLAKRQGARVDDAHRAMSEDVHPAIGPASKATRAAIREIAALRADNILRRGPVPDARAAELHRMSMLRGDVFTEEEHLEWDAAVVQQTFDLVTTPFEVDPAHAVDFVPGRPGSPWMNKPRLFRAMCELRDPAFANPLAKARHVLATSGKTAQYYIDARCHPPAKMVALLEIVAVLGFDSPFDFEAQVELDVEQPRVVGAHELTLETALWNWRRARGQNRAFPGVSLQTSAQQILSQNLFISFATEGATARLEKCGPARHWPEFHYEHARRFEAWWARVSTAEPSEPRPRGWGGRDSGAQEAVSHARSTQSLRPQGKNLPPRGDGPKPRGTASPTVLPEQWQAPYRVAAQQLASLCQDRRWQTYMAGDGLRARLLRELGVAAAQECAAALALGDLGAMEWLVDLVYKKELHLPGLPAATELPGGFRQGAATGDGNNCFISAGAQSMLQSDLGPGEAGHWPEDHVALCRRIRADGARAGVWAPSPAFIAASAESWSFLVQSLGQETADWRCDIYGGITAAALQREGPPNARRVAPLLNQFGVHFVPLWPVAVGPHAAHGANTAAARSAPERASACDPSRARGLKRLRAGVSPSGRSGGEPVKPFAKGAPLPQAPAMLGLEASADEGAASSTQSSAHSHVGDWCSSDPASQDAFRTWYAGPRPMKGQSGSLSGCFAATPGCEPHAPCQQCRARYKQRKYRSSTKTRGGTGDKQTDHI